MGSGLYFIGPAACPPDRLPIPGQPERHARLLMRLAASAHSPTRQTPPRRARSRRCRTHNPDRACQARARPWPRSTIPSASYRWNRSQKNAPARRSLDSRPGALAQHHCANGNQLTRLYRLGHVHLVAREEHATAILRARQTRSARPRAWSRPDPGAARASCGSDRSRLPRACRYRFMSSRSSIICVCARALRWMASTRRAAETNETKKPSRRNFPDAPAQ